MSMPQSLLDFSAEQMLDPLPPNHQATRTSSKVLRLPLGPNRLVSSDPTGGRSS